MHESVRAAWKAANEPLEGAAIPYPYLDVKGLVTVGTGNLIDPVSLALQLPWTINGAPATRGQIVSDWNALKAQAGLAKMHHKYAAPVTKIRLSPGALDDLLYGKLRENARWLTKYHFPDFEAYCADEQLAILSLAWAVGPDWPTKFPKTKRAILARDLVFAANEGVINSKGNPGVIPRNKMNRRCFLNADRVYKLKLDPTKLYWPDEATNTCPTCGRPV